MPDVRRSGLELNFSSTHESKENEKVRSRDFQPTRSVEDAQPHLTQAVVCTLLSLQLIAHVNVASIYGITIYIYMVIP
jgi:hypothetical protein